MDRVLDYIERLRHSSEAHRYRVLVVAVIVSVLLLGTIWIWSFGAQLKPAAISITEQDSVLPSVGELFTNGFKDVTGRAKASLRSLLLETERIEAREAATERQVPLTQTSLSGETLK